MKCRFQNHLKIFKHNTQKDIPFENFRFFEFPVMTQHGRWLISMIINTVILYNTLIRETNKKYIQIQSIFQDEFNFWLYIALQHAVSGPQFTHNEDEQ